MTVTAEEHTRQASLDHPPFNGEHKHAHESHGGPDGDGDGIHAHSHFHDGGSSHDHGHADDTRMLAYSSSGRDDDDDEHARTQDPAEHDRVQPAEHGEHERAQGVDESPWNAQKVWSAGLASDSPASFFAATCAGRRSGDPKLSGTWALPHHYHPGDPPNAAGVQAALGRTGQTQGLTNADAAKAHLEAHEAHIKSVHGKKSDTSSSGTSSSGRQPAAADATSRVTEAGEGTGPPRSAEPQQHPAPPASTTRSSAVEQGQMTLAERLQRRADVRARLKEIDKEFAGAELPPETRHEWSKLQEELVLTEAAIEDANQRAQYLRAIGEDPSGGAAAGEGIDDSRAGYAGRGVSPTGAYSPVASFADRARGTQVMLPPDNIYDLTEIRQRARSIEEVPVLYREHAYRAIDRQQFGSYKAERNPMTRERMQENVRSLLDRVDDETGSLARRILVTGSPLYERAFGKAMKALNTNGLSSEESRALVLGTDASGGYAVPYQLDPTVILTYNGVINPLRSIARVEQITGKEWDGVTSTGIVVSRAAENAEASDNSPALVAPTCRTTRVQGFVPFSVELDMSWGAMRSQLTQMLADAKDIEEATSFTLGNGTAPQCAGVVTTMATTSIVLTAASAAISIADLYNVEDQSAPKFRQTSNWLASKTMYNLVRQLFTQQASAAGDPWVRPSSGTPAEFIGYPAYEASVMSASQASHQNVLLFGDFSHFLIVDRVGMGIELIPHLFGSANRYPTGSRGIYALWFNNSVILASNAFRMLQTL